MRLGILVAATILVLVTLVDAFPQVVYTYQPQTNAAEHMSFARELAQHGTALAALERQQNAMSNLPERMARIEERLDALGKMVWAILGGIFALLTKEVWGMIRSLNARLNRPGKTT